MPKFDIPVEDNESINSSLSLSSNENGSVSNRSMASSVSIGPNNNSPPLEIEQPRLIYCPNGTNFLPVCREPTLDAVLRKSCGLTTNLDTLTHIQMRVSPNVFGLHQMHIFLPNLIALNLDGSSLESLRDLGCDLKVKYLNVSRCGLRSFDGISDTVEHLIADGNAISNVMQLGGLQELHTLSLRNNNIKQFNVICFLPMCTKLNNLDLTNNGITTVADYRQKMKTVIPSLLILDGFGFDETGTNANMTECSSSLTSDISRDSSSISDRMSEAKLTSRPLSETNQFVDTLTIDSSSGRPSTAESSICSGGEPIVGNIVNKVRRKRREKITHNSSNSSSILESSLQNVAKSNKFPMRLPQSSVTLELGIMNTEGMPSSSELGKCDDNQDVHQLIEMCRRWRELSRKSRENHNINSKRNQHDRHEGY
ncbi:uncharacterized protein LOC129577583 [Sitodiplosis mosellana]|uniref:uncharacterized protein LOC129577583 n=1 Tax=Sitodiplosis mosellana TaxID=263140 RepID=UPI0024451496|nr:uncharacterized protein LOC129577583 [Sitodiplosis mosellana]